MEISSPKTSHFQRRAVQRLGYVLHRHEIHPVVNAIRSERAKFLRWIEFGIGVYETELFHRKVHVVFNWDTGIILTVYEAQKRRKQRNGSYRRSVAEGEEVGVDGEECLSHGG